MDKIATDVVSRRAMLLREVIKTAVSVMVLGAGVTFVYLMAIRDQSAATRPPSALVPLVAVVAATDYQGPLELNLSGTVVPFREIRVAAEVSGLVVEKTPDCRAGHYVRAGTPLLTIDRQTYELELATIASEIRQSEAMMVEVEEEIKGLEATIELSQSEVALIERELARNMRLEGVASRSEIDQWERNLLAARTQLVGRQNNLRTAQSRLERMRAALELSQKKQERAQLNLDRTAIVAPSDGVIVSESVQQGDLVAVGSPLLLFEDTSRAEVLVNLSHRDLAWLKAHVVSGQPGQTSEEFSLQDAYQLPAAAIEVIDPREPGLAWRGRLSRFDGIGRDELTRTTPARIAVDQPVIQTEAGPRALVRGMFVRCRLIVTGADRKPGDRLLSLPAKALRPGGLVWTVRDLRLQRHVVEIIGEVPQASPATNGRDKQMIVRWQEGRVDAGDWVVVSPLSQVAVGTEVQIVAEPESPPSAPAESAAGDSLSESAHEEP